MWTRRSDGPNVAMEISYGDGIAGWVADEEEPYLSNDVENDKRFDFKIDTAFSGGLTENSRPFKVSSLMSIPMKRHDGSLFGVYSVINTQVDNRRMSCLD